MQKPAETTTTLASGLKVVINLSEGQRIPRSGYTITVTPLNGATTGAAIAQVKVHINGALVATLQPDEMGTVRWLWQPESVPGTDVVLEVTGSDGSTDTQEFHVSIIADDEAERATGAGGTKSNSSDASANPVARVYTSVKKFVGTLPGPVVYTFPYALFLLLGINVAILLWQATKELREYHLWQTFLARERLAAEEKRTLFQLIAHYFRTPITLLSGGVDLLTPQDAPSTKSLVRLSQRLHDEIEQLLDQTRQTAEPVAGGESMNAGFVTVVRHAGLVLPIALVAAVVVPFNYLVNAAGKLSVSQGNIALQYTVLVLLAVLSYVVYRRLLLRRQDARQSKRIYEQEQAIHRASDELLDGVMETLRGDAAELARLAAQLPATVDAQKFIADGSQRLQDLTGEIATAERLIHAKPTEKFAAVSLAVMLERAQKPVRAKVAELGLRLRLPQDSSFAVRDPELAAYVLTSVLDNAVSYSHEGGTVAVAVAQTTTETTITVADEGDGIPKDKQPLLFQPFSRADGVETFTHEGMGFSLYLNKLIMQYLGGEIRLESEPKRGTMVTLRFPRPEADVAA
ncbi:MAG TPA: ATP-binding protein [Candidatus Saccharimonadales bacterium]|nr:ATP-binding protein [Candidatus Saccharimonadales bacterium]